MTQSPSSPRADEAPQAALRAPGQLKLALPLTAALGALLVGAAAATGASANIVALVAVAGFAILGVVPVALMEAFVGRPLRAALRQLRAARDGKPAPAERPFALGLVGDLVRVAADLGAAQLHAERQGAALDRIETLASAQEAAIRALREQADERAAPQAETPSKRAAPAPWGEMAEAIKSLRAQLPGQTFDGAVERIETMLVYLAESMERGEARDKQAEEALGRVERAFGEIPRLVARGGETLEGRLVEIAKSLRADLAAASAGDKAQQGQWLDLFESFESRVLARLADIGPLDLGKFAELVRHEGDSIRRALRERDEDAAELGGKLAEVADQLAQRVDAAERIAGETLPAAQAALQAASEKLDAAAEQLAAPPEAMLRLGEQFEQRLGAIEAQVSAPPPVADLAPLRADLGALHERLDAAAAALEGHLQAQAERLLSEWDARIETARPALDEAATRLHAEIAALTQELARQGEQLSPMSAEISALGPSLAAIDAGPIDVARRALGAASVAVAESEARLNALAGRLDTGLATLADAAKAGALDFEALRGEVGGLSEKLARAASEAAARIENVSQSLGGGVAEGLQALSGAMGGLVQTGARWGELTRQIEQLAAAAAERPDIDALAQRFEDSARAQAVRLVERFAEFDRSVFASMLSAFDAMTRDLAETRERLDRSVAAVTQAAGRDEAHVEAVRNAIAEGAARLDRRLEQLGEQAPDRTALEARLDAFEARLAGGVAPEAIEALRAELREIGAQLGDALARMAARAEAAPRPPAQVATAAMTKLALSLAHALDLRFGEIEATLGALSGEPPSEAAAAEIAAKLAEAAAQLRAGLAEFAGVSATLAEEAQAKSNAGAAVSALG